MMTNTGQSVLSILATLLLWFVASERPSAEKLSMQRAGVPIVRAANGVQRSSVLHRPAKIRQIASWYGDEFQGKLTANGETFDQNKLTAAHRTLPFGSLVKLIAAKTGRSVIVRINDRGPWLKGRDFDLSEAAATKLGIHDTGIAAVEAVVLRASSSVPQPGQQGLTSTQ